MIATNRDMGILTTTTTVADDDEEEEEEKGKTIVVAAANGKGRGMAKGKAMTKGKGNGKGEKNLDQLPDELLIRILEALPERRDLTSTCLVSRRMNALADPVLYKSVLFEQPARHMLFSESLSRTRGRRRGSLILNVRLEYPGHADEIGSWLGGGGGGMVQSPVDKFSHTISTMSNLETLVIAVPERLAHGIGHLFNHPFALACLRWCSLFYQRDDDGFWDLQENIHIFSHPTLEHLTIRKGKLDERGFDSLEKPSQTGLKELHFIDCDINDDALSDILLHPEALQTFTMTMSADDPSMPEAIESPADAGDYIFALNSAQHSLETISIDNSNLGGRKALRLRDFTALKKLELRDYQLFGSTSKKPRLHSVGLPPVLETLTFFGQVGEDEEVLDLLENLIEQKEIMARSLRRLVLARGKGSLPERIVRACETVGLAIE